MAEKIKSTISQAFDLAYEVIYKFFKIYNNFKKFVRKNGDDLEKQKQMLLLRKRVAELEAENKELKRLLFLVFFTSILNYLNKF